MAPVKLFLTEMRHVRHRLLISKEAESLFLRTLAWSLPLFTVSRKGGKNKCTIQY